jgi:hypothetical protein
MVGRESDSICVLSTGMASGEFSSTTDHPKQKSGSDVQAAVDVTVKLARRHCWRWVSGSDSFRSSWRVELNTEMVDWLRDNRISYKKYLLMDKPETGKRSTNDVYLRFSDVKAARTFILAWGSEYFGNAQFEELFHQSINKRKKVAWKK